MGELVPLKKVQQDRQLQEIIEKVQKVSERYEGDIRRFVTYCAETDQNEDIDALLRYLAYSMNTEKVKKTTWERRYHAAKKYIEVTYGEQLTVEQKGTFLLLRKAFGKEEYSEQLRGEAKEAADKEDLLEMIRGLEDPRDRAICLVNLITGNRPSEMVRMQIKDFNLSRRTVKVFLKKQSEEHTKMLTEEAAEAVREYIRAYELKGEDYFVGRARRGRNFGSRYESVKISEVGYNKMIQRLLGVAPYVLRKTLVSDMNEKGASLSTIQRQTGHKSTKTLTDYYISVADRTVEKYL